ncbi:DUF6602 domain-containing protein [Janthinobacterium sp. HLX7-2]|uniref:DUF6602 domain-containing protein n=1 Tax=Janthinobacterium sp. HLX7-2 TaxID=1259331 RepID=UPI003F1EC3CB
MQVLSELLKKMSDREKIILNDYPIKHAPTIGKMYEGLTKRLLNESMLDKYGVKVVSGFIQVSDERSGQIDCMVVIGDGSRIPHTDDFVYPICQVLAVIEVKKNLFATEIAEAYHHLNDTLRLSKLALKLQEDEKTLEFSTARPALEYLYLFGELAPRYEENHVLPFHKRVIYHTLVRDSLTPLRIAIGYNGYKSELGFRRGFGRLYDNKSNVLGYGVINMPNLMISDGFSIVKTTGLPYRGFWDEKAGWGWLSSSGSNPLLLILELLYARIELVLKVAVDYGSDLEDEVLYPLMLGRPVQVNSQAGWNYTFINAPLPKGKPRSQEWTPLEVSEYQKEVLDLLHAEGELSGDDQKLARFKDKYSIDDVYELVQPLLDARLMINSKGILSIAPAKVLIAKVAEKWYCGSEADGRFQQWLAR